MSKSNYHSTYSIQENFSMNQSPIPSVRKSNPLSSSEARARKENETCHSLILSFITHNDKLAITSLVSYCLTRYKEYGVTKDIISDAIKTYIDTKYE